MIFFSDKAEIIDRDFPSAHHKLFPGHIHQQRYFIPVAKRYQLVFATRNIEISFTKDAGKSPFIYTELDKLEFTDKNINCFWSCSEDDFLIPEENRNARWICHMGLDKDHYEQFKERVILLPRIDLLEIRYIPQTPKHYKIYRTAISQPWKQKKAEVFFLGQHTDTKYNSRIKACQLIKGTSLPADVGLLSDFLPKKEAFKDLVKPKAPLYKMGNYRYILSLWGRHPFNPRLFRGLEAGSLVFHQQTPSVVQLHDPFLKAGEHYIGIAPDLSDLLDKLAYYMDHEKEARKIAENGHKQWMKMFYIDKPYQFSDFLWEKFTQQENWDEFYHYFKGK